MDVYAGTSGYSYKEWKGPFYPEKLPAAKMLAYYGSQLPAVEINNTFYRLPKASMLEGWCEKVPEEFRFSVKASRKITHHKRLQDAGDETGYLLDTLKVLGARLGAVLFQLPPFLRVDLERLQRFAASLPAGTPAVFEFRHESWFDETVFACLSEHGFALCVSDTDKTPDPPLVRTAPFAYLRLRRPDYDDASLQAWLSRVNDEPYQHVFAFFKHEDEGIGPRLAARFQQLSASHP